jgi:hypothetical protein
MSNNRLCLFETRDSEEETIPDEDYSISNRGKRAVNSWYVGESNYPRLNDGPNINLKYFKKKYVTDEEKHYITKKIRSKKKTELCKNWEIYHDCYFKNECSYAHGLDELRTDTPVSGSKNRLCKSFQEKGFCLFGKRCNYRHVIKEERLFTYNSILNYNSNEIFNEMNKPENKDVSILKIYKRLLLNKRVIM